MRFSAWIIVIVATALTELTTGLFLLPATLASIAGLLVIGVLLGLPARRSGQAGAWIVTGMILTTALSPGVALALGRSAPPLEVLLLVLCRNGMLALAISGAEPMLRRAVVLGIYVAVVATLLLDGASSLIGLAVLSASVCGWLIASHRHPEERPVSATPLPAGPVAAVVGIVTLAALATGVVVGTGRSIVALAGFLPSSGGIQQGSDRARGGLGDGPDQIAGSRDPRATGFDDSEVFVNSDLPGLYDVFVEAFGEPLPTGAFQRMVGLKQEQILASGAHVDSDLRMGRQFSLLRKPRPPRGHWHDARDADAVLWARGFTPMHIRLAVYDVFDGQAWHESADLRHNPALDNSDPDRWLVYVDRPGSRVLGGKLRSEVRIGRLSSDVVPLAPHALRFRMGRVTRPDFFRAGAPDMLKMFNRTVPAGSIIECHSLGVDHAALQSASLAAPTGSPPALDPALIALRDQWCKDAAPGWAQVQAVVNGLRSHARHDADAAVANDDVLGHLLISKRTGPSYAFATSAVLMLRSLGYEARMVCGFYVDQANASAGDGYLAAHAHDAHCWAEVKLADGTWITIEPTPGYAIPTGAERWQTRLAERAQAVLAWAVAHGPWVAGAVLAMGILCLLRVRLLDLALLLRWRVGRGVPSRQRIGLALAIVEHRARQASRARPPWQTVGRWLDETRLGSPELARMFAALVDWAAYAPLDVPAPVPDAERVCQAILNELTHRRLGRPSASISPAITLRYQ